jgi:hypothetical protein
MRICSKAPWQPRPGRNPYDTCQKPASKDPSLSHSRPRGFCLCGTFSPSRRQIRSTRSLPTCQPARWRERRDPTIAIATILAGQRYDGLGERIFVVALCRSIALCAAWLFHHTARTPLAHAVRLPRMVHRTVPSFRAQKFPEAMSFSTSFSRLNSETSRFSFAFSCSSSFSRRAWSTVNPPNSLRHR